jgi:ferrous iron transport protein A
MQLRITIMTLWELPAKQSASITGLCPQLDTPVAERLAEMGFTENSVVRCIRRTPCKGPIVLQVGDCVYSLEQAIATRILTA